MTHRAGHFAKIFIPKRRSELSGGMLESERRGELDNNLEQPNGTRELIVQRVLKTPALVDDSIELLLETNIGQLKISMSTDIARSIASPIADALSA